jgi:hypothetical protein
MELADSSMSIHGAVGTEDRNRFHKQEGFM